MKFETSFMDFGDGELRDLLVKHIGEPVPFGAGIAVVTGVGEHDEDNRFVIELEVEDEYAREIGLEAVQESG